jgi:CheY-like chemotaxis protein
MGYEVVIARDGEEAARAFEASGGRVSLAILDVVMPRLGGLQAYDRMREKAPDLKVVFTTGYEPDRAQERIPSGPCRALLAKPFSLETLGQVIRRVLDGDDGA